MDENKDLNIDVNNEPEDNKEPEDNNEKTYTQADIDRIIESRLARQKEKFEEEQNRAKMTELEKANAEKADLQKEIDNYKNEASEKELYSKIVTEAAKHDVYDLESVYHLLDKNKIEKTEQGFVGIDLAVKDLLKEKPFLVKANTTQINTGDPGQGQGEPDKKFDMNTLMRRAIKRY